MRTAEVTDREEWENFLLKNNPAALFQSWDWGMVQIDLGNTVIRLGWYENGALVAIAQIVCVRAKRGVFLHIRHGPVVRTDMSSPWEQVVAALKNQAHAHRALFIRISPLIPNTPENQSLLHAFGFIPAAIHAMDAELCWLLDLTPTAEEILKNMRKTTRYEIRKAESLGVQVHSSDTVKDIHQFMTLYDTTISRHGFVGHKGILEEFMVFARRKQAVLLSGIYDGQIQAAAIILFYGNQGIYHHGASVASKIPVSSLVQWEAIKLTKQRGYAQYNFWGIADDDNTRHPWKGLTLFKKGFGGFEQRYIHAQDLPIHPLYIIPRSVEIVRKRMKGY